MGEAIFSALGGGLRGLERGLLMKNQLKQQAIDQQLQMEDRAIMQQDRAMQQREFELQMKRAGLELESAEFEHERQLALGTPKEQADRELQERQTAIQQDVEMHAAQLAQIRSATAENEAQAQYYQQGGSRGAGQSEEDKSFTDAQKVIDGEIRAKENLLEQAVESEDAEAEAVIRQDLMKLYTQRELLTNSELNRLGMPMDQFGLGGQPQQQAPVEQPEVEPQGNVLDKLMQSARAQQSASVLPQVGMPPAVPRMAGEISVPSLPQGMSLNPLKGFGGLFNAAAGIAQAVPNPFAPVSGTPTTGPITLNRLTPELIARMRAAGVLPPEQNLLGLVRNNAQQPR